jgi:hypothetical protein
MMFFNNGAQNTIVCTNNGAQNTIVCTTVCSEYDLKVIRRTIVFWTLINFRNIEGYVLRQAKLA